jgi:hypothetical protein
MLRIFSIFILLTLVGCAPPSTMKLERIAKIKKMGVVTRLAEDDLKIFDHTGTMKKSYTYGQFGALPVLIEGLILWGEARYKISNSIVGDPDQIKTNLIRKNIKYDVESALTDKLSKKYNIVRTEYFEAKALTSSDKNKCLEEAKQIGVDTLVFLEFAYGLAAYNGKPASVSIDGEIVVYDVSTAKIVLKKEMESDQDFREYRTIADFAKEDGKLFKEDLNGAINGFSSYVARQLGVWQ